MATVRVCWLGAFVAVLGACNQDDGPGEEMRFCNLLAQRECDTIALSCSRERTTCITIRSAVCETRAEASRSAGRSFVSRNAGPCLDQTRATYAKPLIQAADFQMLEEKCGRVFEGSAGNNDPCIADADCRGPLVCDKRRCGELKTVAANANCGNPGERCPAEQYCKQGDGFFACTPRNVAGAVCSTNGECAEGLRCRGMACVPKLMLDAECAGDDDCLSGYCDPYPPAGRTRTCATGLNFARFSPSCDGYFGVAAQP
jgi:hypothetical protein